MNAHQMRARLTKLAAKRQVGAVLFTKPPKGGSAIRKPVRNATDVPSVDRVTPVKHHRIHPAAEKAVDALNKQAGGQYSLAQGATALWGKATKHLGKLKRVAKATKHVAGPAARHSGAAVGNAGTAAGRAVGATKAAVAAVPGKLLDKPAASAAKDVAASITPKVTTTPKPTQTNPQLPKQQSIGKSAWEGTKGVGRGIKSAAKTTAKGAGLAAGGVLVGGAAHQALKDDD
jgi:hypothetical protein